MSTANIAGNPPRSRRFLLLALGAGMNLDMASHASHMATYATAGLGIACSVVAQAAPNTDVGQAGLIVGAGNLTVLVLLVVRDVVPKAFDYASVRATARDEYIKTQVALENVEKAHGQSLAELAVLKAELEAARQDAREARNLVENEKIASDARAKAIEGRAREAGHLARNNAQKIANSQQEIEDIKKVLGSDSGDCDPELAL